MEESLSIFSEDLNSGILKGSSNYKSYTEEFKESFGTRETIQGLKAHLVAGKIKRTKFRGILWSLLFNLLEDETHLWSKSISLRRRAYENWKSEFTFDHRSFSTHNEPTLDNPLSSHAESFWNLFFEDKEIAQTISLDVKRTYPGLRFFHQEAIQSIMKNVLFIYAKKHSNLVYKQGMHELLAAILLVLSSDNYHYHEFRKHEGTSFPKSEKDSLFELIFDFKFLESDSYFLFDQLMHNMWDWYYIPNGATAALGNNEKNSKHFLLPNDANVSKLFVDKTALSSLDNASRRLEYIWNVILKEHDKELYDHLNALDVLPSTFGVNWMKLLYSRQFFDKYEFLNLWDVIIASEFEIADYILPSMILAIKESLLSKDSTGCNSLLVTSYPSTLVTTNYVIKYAFHLFDSESYSKPSVSYAFVLGQTLIREPIFSKCVVDKLTRRKNSTFSSSSSSSSSIRSQSRVHNNFKNHRLSSSISTTTTTKGSKDVELSNFLSSKKGSNSVNETYLRSRIFSWHQILSNILESFPLNTPEEGKIKVNLATLVKEMTSILVELSSSETHQLYSLGQDALDLLTP